MNTNDRIIRSLLAIISVSIFFMGTTIAQDYYGSSAGETMALRTPEVSASVPIASAVLVPSVASSSYCFRCLPSPRLIYTGKEDYTVSGTTYTRYKLAVANRDDYPASLFKPAPDLPPCGLNTNSARTWANIYDSSGTYIYGFCALSSPSDLAGLWFAVPKGRTPPRSVYLTLNDRRCRIILKSNLVTIS